MRVFKQVARVRMARSRMAAARVQLSQPAGALLGRGREYPLTTVGLAAGTGFALGSLNVQPLRVPGMASLLGGGLAEAVTHGTRLLAELAALGAAAKATGADAAAPAASDAPP
ncbi:MAG: hypothetical protein EPN69_14485 [Rhodanobacter sp.]|nr:MAG: hypothetical protein EPN69_14485 [Rhodanobacter sp.]TAM00557.1 MAG: hypothetical protein EPN71_06465 [Rhodanobacter sp.]TAM42951.1 MAG: hypothetical protein EPN58_01265 [Rhodanobacter sp.]TAN25599.1 MAG: hypothetical protein EPN32_09685 [Rhodanobacter sp.]